MVLPERISSALCIMRLAIVDLILKMLNALHSRWFNFIMYYCALQFHSFHNFIEFMAKVPVRSFSLPSCILQAIKFHTKMLYQVQTL